MPDGTPDGMDLEDPEGLEGGGATSDAAAHPVRSALLSEATLCVSVLVRAESHERRLTHSSLSKHVGELRWPSCVKMSLL